MEAFQKQKDSTSSMSSMKLFGSIFEVPYFLFRTPCTLSWLCHPQHFPGVEQRRWRKKLPGTGVTRGSWWFRSRDVISRSSRRRRWKEWKEHWRPGKSESHSSQQSFVKKGTLTGCIAVVKWNFRKITSCCPSSHCSSWQMNYFICHRSILCSTVDFS